MGTGDLIGLPAGAAALLTGYLSRLDALLPLPAAARDRIISEAADALVCETQALISAGEVPETAARVAVAGFGDPAALARQFTDALAPGMARRAGLMMIGSGPLVGLCWVAAIGTGTEWMRQIASVVSAVPLLPVILAFSVPAAAVAASAKLSPLRLNVFAACVAVFGCVGADALLIATTAGHFASGRVGLSVWVACAAALSLLRLTLAAASFQRLWRLRGAGC